MTASGINKPQVKHIAFPFRRCRDVSVGASYPLGFTDEDWIRSIRSMDNHPHSQNPER